MLEGLVELLGLRLYYWSGLSWLVLLPVYLIAALVLGIYGWRRVRRGPSAWKVLLGLAALLGIAPWVEELWIAWNFGRLCRQDAGIFIYKTVEAEGYYDATAVLLDVQQPVPRPAAEYYEKSGFKFYELTLMDKRGGPNKVVHLEKANGEWTATVLDRPTARYHYQWPHMNAPSGYKVEKTERRVVDIQTQEVLGRYVDYGRRAPWFYVGLDAPLMFCEEGETDARELGSTFGPRMVLRPVRQSLQSEEIRR